MKILVSRDYKKEEYTIGNIYVNGEWIANSLEDKDRGLSDSMKEYEIKEKKVYGKTAIPTGTYKVTLKVQSPRFSKFPYYKKLCDGRLPRILDVKGFEGVLFHIMDGSRGADLSEGCIGVGRNLIKGGLLQGKKYFEQLYAEMELADSRGEEIILEVK